MYQDKLANLKRQLEELKSHSHPELIRRIKKLEHQFHERHRINEIYRDYLIDCVERDYISEKNAAVKEYEEKKMDLKENLLTDFEDKRKLIESERHTMELTGDSIDLKPQITRKLRRRPNDPLPTTVEKRRKPTSGQLVLLLEDKEIDGDLKLISRGKSSSSSLRQMSSHQLNISNGSANSSFNNSGGSSSGMMMMNMSTGLSNDSSQLVETRIEDGKLLYERRWFHRGQAVYVEGKDVSRFSANISGINNDIIWVKRTSDNSKVRIYTQQLSRGKISIKRRAN